MEVPTRKMFIMVSIAVARFVHSVSVRVREKISRKDVGGDFLAAANAWRSEAFRVHWCIRWRSSIMVSFGVSYGLDLLAPAQGDLRREMTCSARKAEFSGKSFDFSPNSNLFFLEKRVFNENGSIFQNKFGRFPKTHDFLQKFLFLSGSLICLKRLWPLQNLDSPGKIPHFLWIFLGSLEKSPMSLKTRFSEENWKTSITPTLYLLSFYISLTISLFPHLGLVPQFLQKKEFSHPNELPQRY